MAPPKPGTKPDFDQNPETTGLGSFFGDAWNWVSDQAETVTDGLTDIWVTRERADAIGDVRSDLTGAPSPNRDTTNRRMYAGRGMQLNTRTLALIGGAAVLAFALARA